MDKSGGLELGDNIYGHYRSIFNHCDVFNHQSNRIRRKTQNKGYYAVQAIQGHPDRYQWKARMRLSTILVINSNWHPISFLLSELSQIIVKFWTLCVFLVSLWGLRDNVLRWSSWAHWKARMDFLLVLIELFFAWCYGWGGTGKIDRKSPFRSNAVCLTKNLKYKGTSPSNHFCMDSWAIKCVTTLSLTVFIKRNCIADFLQGKCDFRRKTVVLLFWAPFGGLRSNVRWSS